MDVRYINPFISSCRAIFDKMIHLPVQLGKPSLRNNDTPQFAVSAVIGLSGPVTGSVVLGFAQPVALALASGLLGSPVKSIDADTIDALGEIANMISGSAKAEFPGELTQLSLPNVVLGSHRVAYPANVPIIVIPCETSAGPFVIEVALRPATPTEAAPKAAVPATVGAN